MKNWHIHSLQAYTLNSKSQLSIRKKPQLFYTFPTWTHRQDCNMLLSSHRDKCFWSLKDFRGCYWYSFIWSHIQFFISSRDRSYLIALYSLNVQGRLSWRRRASAFIHFSHFDSHIGLYYSINFFLWQQPILLHIHAFEESQTSDIKD